MTATIVKKIGVQCRSNRSRLRGSRKRFSRHIVTGVKWRIGQDPALAQWPVDQKIIKIGNFVEKNLENFLCYQIQYIKGRQNKQLHA